MEKENLLEILNYFATTKEVQMFDKYQRLLQEVIALEKAPKSLAADKKGTLKQKSN